MHQTSGAIFLWQPRGVCGFAALFAAAVCRRGQRRLRSPHSHPSLLPSLPRPPARPQNDKGQNVDLYIPRKCSWTHRLITVHDHAAIQVRGSAGWRADAPPPPTPPPSARLLPPRRRRASPFLQVHVAKVDADGKAIRGQEDTYAICGYVRDKVRSAAGRRLSLPRCARRCALGAEAAAVAALQQQQQRHLQRR